MAKENVYEVCNFFQIRMPTYPIDKIHLVDIHNILDYFINETYFQEAIFCANEKLFRRLVSGEANEVSFKDKSTLLNYFKRMSTRATPFGLFAGVTVGKFGNRTYYNDSFSLKKNYSVSNEWLHKLIEQYKTDEKLIEVFTIQRNRNVYLKDSRLYLFYNNSLLEADEMSTTSIGISRPVKSILELCETPKTGTILINYMVDQYGPESEVKIRKLIVDLIKNNYLFTNLDKNNVLIGDIICALSMSEDKKYRDDVIQLKYITKKIEDINKTKVFDFLETDELLSRMRDLCNNEHCLQQNQSITELNIILDKKIADQISEVFSLLWKYGAGELYSDDLSYYSFFLDYYGENMKVPLKELYTKDHIIKNLKLTEKHHTEIFNEILEAIYDCKKEVRLDNFFISEEDDDKDVVEVPNLEVYGQILSDGRFILNNQMLSGTIGATFGRFLAKEDMDCVRQSLVKYYADSDTAFVELIFNSKVNNWKNLFAPISITDHNIELNFYNADSKSLDIDDLYIVAHDKQFYIWSDRLNTYINIIKINMFNENLLPDIYKVILDFLNYNRPILNYRLFTVYNSIRFCPRIVFKDIILKPMTWSIKYDPSGNEDLDIAGTRRRYKIDRYVYYVADDRKLLIDLENAVDIKYLQTEIKKSKLIILEEIIGLEDILIRKCGMCYVNEVVISLSGKNRLDIDRPYAMTHETKLLCGEYLYVNLYVKEMDMDLLLINYLKAYFEELENSKQLFERVFFIRYSDPKPHIRIRFKGKREQLHSLLDEINAFYLDLREKNMVSEIRYNVYLPEYIRYGGKKYFQFVEEYFCLDSAFVIDLLELKRKYGEAAHKNEIVIVYAFIQQLKNIGFSYLDLKNQIDLDSKKYKKLLNYRDFKENLFYYFNDFTEDEYICEIKRIVYKREQKSQLYKLACIEDKKYFFNIILSILHMTCNRITMSDKNFELRVYELLRNFIRDLKYWEDLRW